MNWQVSVLRTGVVIKAFLLVVCFVLYQLFRDYVHVYISATVATLILTYIGLSALVSAVRFVILRSYLLRNDFSVTHVDNFTTVLRRVSTATIHIAFVFVLFAVLGIELRELLTSISLFAVALTLIFKEYITNFLSGTSVLFSNRYRVNDYVKVGEYKGRIRDVSFQSVELVTDSGEVVYIPNSVLLQKEVANLSKLKEKTVFEEHEIELPTAKQFDALEQELKESLLKAFPERVERVSLSLVKAEKDTASVKVSVRVKKYSYELEQAVHKHLAKQVLGYRKKHQSRKKKK